MTLAFSLMIEFTGIELKTLFFRMRLVVDSVYPERVG